MVLRNRARWPFCVSLESRGAVGRAAVDLRVDGFTLAAQELSLTESFDPTRNVSDAVHDLRVVADSHTEASIMARGRATGRAGDPLDASSYQLLSGRTVGVFPSELTYAWGYRLNWDPFPVLQGYTAYTSSLDAMDADFLTFESCAATDPRQRRARHRWPSDVVRRAADEQDDALPLPAVAGDGHDDGADADRLPLRCADVAGDGARRVGAVGARADPSDAALPRVRADRRGRRGGGESIASLFYKPAQRWLAAQRPAVGAARRRDRR